MPIYEYECGKCGEIFEVMQKMSDPPPKKHTCGSKRVKRVMSRSSFILKGSGWYVTDYARKDKGGDSASGSANTDNSAKKSESKSESKADSKSDSKSDSKKDSGKHSGQNAA